MKRQHLAMIRRIQMGAGGTEGGTERTKLSLAPSTSGGSDGRPSNGLVAAMGVSFSERFYFQHGVSAETRQTLASAYTLA
jgi:hypothetical protein